MYPNQRIGQTYFTVLSQISPTLAQEVLCTEGLDPFYISMASPAEEAQIRRFLDFVRARLPKLTGPDIMKINDPRWGIKPTAGELAGLGLPHMHNETCRCRERAEAHARTLPSVGGWSGEPADVKPTATRVDGDDTE